MYWSIVNNVVLVSGAQQSDSVTHIHISILFQIFFPFRLLQNIEQSSLCCTVGLCWLSILNIAVCTCQSRIPSLSLPTLPSLLVTIVCSLSLWVCFCFVNKFICIIFKILHVSDIIWHLSFSVWLTSLSISFLFFKQGNWGVEWLRNNLYKVTHT